MKTHEYTCIECGTKFEATQPAKYCSPRCKSTHQNHVTVRVQCIFCGTIFSARRNNKAKFCSHKCVSDAHKYVEEHPDSELAKIVKPRKKPKEVTRYCIDCGRSFPTLSTKTVNRRCPECLKEYKKLWSAGAGELLVELSTSTGHRRELVQAAISNFVEENHINVPLTDAREACSESQSYIEPTKTRDEHNAKRRYLRSLRKALKGADPDTDYDRTGYRKRVLEASEQLCCMCDYSDYVEALQIHHIDMNRDNNVSENLSILCANCHAILHSRIRKNMSTYKDKKAGIIAEFQTLKAEIKSRNKAGSPTG